MDSTFDDSQGDQDRFPAEARHEKQEQRIKQIELHLDGDGPEGRVDAKIGLGVVIMDEESVINELPPPVMVGAGTNEHE